uniref:Uncharacterized protein n=1 Tax=Thermogemmatispora argillosa TaxID=2045280 RepID=A0A455T6D2_9CHLR|nr:hypothetical protein KTA_33610 [Thermogemmatispora argillosa]
MTCRETPPPSQARQQPAVEEGWSALALARLTRPQVSALLGREGYRLTFRLAACRRRWGWLPAQYHYTDAAGTEVIWLAGPDPELREADPQAPAHRSRFWVYASRRAPERAEQIRARLRQVWGLDWYPLPEPPAPPLRPTS